MTQVLAPCPRQAAHGAHVLGDGEAGPETPGVSLTSRPWIPSLVTPCTPAIARLVPVIVPSLLYLHAQS